MRTEYVTRHTHTFLEPTVRCQLSACLSSFHPLPFHYMFSYTFNSLHYIVSAVFPICTRRIEHSCSV